MSEDLENKLRQALRPIDPGEEFTARVLARVATEPPRLRRSRRVIWLPAALAAGTVLVLVGAHVWHVRQEQAGRAARDQVMEALRVTSEKLDLAYRTVNAPVPAEDGAGA